MSSERDTDLSVLSRRGPLSEAETSRLREVLASSDEERWLHDAGLGFDEEAPVVPGDEARIERIVRRVHAAKRPTRIALRSRIARGAFGILLAAGVAAAGVTGQRLWSEHDEEAIATTQKAAAPSPAPRKRQPAGQPRAVEAPAAPAPQKPAGALAVPAPSRVERERTGSVAPGPTSPHSNFGSAPLGSDSVPSASFETLPSELPVASGDATTGAATADSVFAAANRERMRGNAVGAIALYERLRAEFPGSTEAAASSVTLGVLHLQLGEPDRALSAFRRAPATAEALWGQAQALRQLGRGQEERTVLRDILTRHPGSAYATAAEKRLAELN